MGILQNVFVAGWSRRPEAFGVPLDFVGVYGQTRVMNTLLEVEDRYPTLGRSMRDQFFPGRLKEDELRRWEELEKRAEDIGQKLRRSVVPVGGMAPVPVAHGTG